MNMNLHHDTCKKEEENTDTTRITSDDGDDDNASKRSKAKMVFHKNKFGMFIHWGLYSMLASTYHNQIYYGISEWIMHPQMANIPTKEYMAYADSFHPTKFNATSIVQLAKRTGMKYIIMTAKHHDGFAMYHTKVGNFGIAQTPWKVVNDEVDPVREISKEARKEGLGFGIYYSHNQDWTFPGGTGGPSAMDTAHTGPNATFYDYFEQKCLPQIHELTTQYGELDMIWFDTPYNMPKVHVEQIVKVVRHNQPGALISGRVGYGLGDYKTLGDMEIPDRTMNTNAAELWECVDTINDSWGYASYDRNWKTPKQILIRFLSCIARGGTYLLNIGPNGDGEIVEPTLLSLDFVGRWMQRYGHTIYCTEGSPWDHGFPWGDVTRKDNYLYLFVFEWPRNGGRIYLPGLLHNEIVSVYFATPVEEASSLDEMKEKVKIPFEMKDDGILIIQISSLPYKILVPVIEIMLRDVPIVVDSTWMIDPSMPTDISSEFALTQGGAEKSTCRWMEKFGEWKSVVRVHKFTHYNSKAMWEVIVLVPGYYAVDLTYTGKGRIGWNVTVEGLHQSIQNEQSSSHNYQKFPIGWIHFPHKGKFTISVHCISVKWTMENPSLKSIHFHPICI